MINIWPPAAEAVFLREQRPVVADDAVAALLESVRHRVQPRLRLLLDVALIGDALPRNELLMLANLLLM